jgi:hypothetical protein
VQDLVVIAVKGPALPGGAAHRAAARAAHGGAAGDERRALVVLPGPRVGDGQPLASVDPGGVHRAAIALERCGRLRRARQHRDPSRASCSTRWGQGLIVGEPRAAAATACSSSRRLLGRAGFEVTHSADVRTTSGTSCGAT